MVCKGRHDGLELGLREVGLQGVDERPPAEAGGLHPIGDASLLPPKGGGLLSDETGTDDEGAFFDWDCVGVDGNALPGASGVVPSEDDADAVKYSAVAQEATVMHSTKIDISQCDAACPAPHPGPKRLTFLRGDLALSNRRGAEPRLAMEAPKDDCAFLSGEGRFVRRRHDPSLVENGGWAIALRVLARGKIEWSPHEQWINCCENV